MYAVHFYENKNLLLTQLLGRIPDEGEDLKIKGRKCKVSSVNSISDTVVHVQVILEVVKKSKQVVADNSKKRRR